MTFTEVCGVDATNFVRSHAKGSSAELWHCQFGHVNVKSVYAFQSIVRDMNLGETPHPTSTMVCKACTKGKQYVAKLGNNVERKARKPLEIIHLGNCSPHEDNAIGRGKIFYYFQ